MERECGGLMGCGEPAMMPPATLIDGVERDGMKVDSLKKMAVVSISDGAKLGYIDDVLFDTRQLRVSALHIVAGGQQGVVPFRAVHSLGGDAVTVSSSDVAQWGAAGSAMAAMPRLADVEKLKVVDETGSLLGTISDLEIDPTDGRITQIRVHKGGVLGIGGTNALIAPEDIRSVGDEVMVVATSAQPAG